MTPTPIKAGDTVYSADGGMALYVSTAHGGGHIVQPLIEDGDGIHEPESHYADGVEIWPTCYLEPPQLKLDAQIREQTEKLAALRREVAEVERLKLEVQREGAALQDRLKQHAALRYLDDLIAGKLPPLCVRFDAYSGPSIVSTADALKNPDADRGYREPALKLLTLFGSSKGDLQWRLNQYHDGSGQWNMELFFVRTEEEAVAEIRRRYALAVDDWRLRPADRKHYGEAIAWVHKLPAAWLDVPEDVQAYISAAKRKHAEDQAAKAREQLAEAQAKLDALTVT